LATPKNTNTKQLFSFYLTQTKQTLRGVTCSCFSLQTLIKCQKCQKWKNIAWGEK